MNKGYEVINYGALPLSSGDSLPTLDGASTTVPADGVLPARAYTEDVSFSLSGAYDETDMWYVTDEYRERLFHVKQFVKPSWLRIDVRIPKSVTQGRFQRDKVVTGVDKDFGFRRGVFEVVHLPKIHYGYRYCNETNLNVYTFVKFIYAEYIVEIPRNSDLIFRVLSKQYPSYWLTLPIVVYDPIVAEGLKDTYGIEGFTVYRSDQRSEAIREYEKLLEEVMV